MDTQEVGKMRVNSILIERRMTLLTIICSSIDWMHHELTIEMFQVSTVIKHLQQPGTLNLVDFGELAKLKHRLIHSQ